MPVTHELKTWPAYFGRIIAQDKTFELRKADREFAIGDILRLKEYNPVTKKYTGREIRKQVTYILLGGQFGLEEGYCIMSLKQPDYEL